MNTRRPLLTALATASTLLLLASCASLGDGPAPAARTRSDDWAAARKALHAGDWQAAQPPLAHLLQQDLRNADLQFLYALSQEQQARESDLSKLAISAVGYANAVRFAPEHYWALLRLAGLELERGDWQQAQGHFAAAALEQPARWEAFYGLGVASYYRQDGLLLQLAARRALALAPGQHRALRLAALASATQGDAEARELASKALAAEVPAAEQQRFSRRVDALLDSASLQAVALSDEGVTAAPPAPAPQDASEPSQVVVEVTILLSSMLDEKTRGVNLFDGLRLLYGYSNLLQHLRDVSGTQNSRTITSQISTPQLDYSLNLFNNSGQYYSVVARPSITALLGRESQFFAGRTINVEVSGVNLGRIEPIDVGVKLSVLPQSIDALGVTFKLDASRSFLSRELAGSFERSLTLFRQSVGATAQVAFGQTLVLSALSEQVSDKSFSKVPGAGDVPVLDWVTSHSVDIRRQESLLILVTPSLPVRIEAAGAAREREAQRLLELWQQRVDPQSNLEAVIRRLRQSPWLRKPQRGDLPLQVDNPEQLKLAIEETLSIAER